MEESVNPIETLYEKTKEYGKTHYDLIKLKAVEKTTDVLASVKTRMLVMFFVFMSVMILSIAVSIWLSEWLNNYSYGFFLVAAFYAVVAFIVGVLFRHSIKRGFNNSLIRQLLG